MIERANPLLHKDYTHISGSETACPTQSHAEKTLSNPILTPKKQNNDTSQPIISRGEEVALSDIENEAQLPDDNETTTTQCSPEQPRHAELGSASQSQNTGIPKQVRNDVSAVDKSTNSYELKSTNSKLAEYGIDLNKPFEVTKDMLEKMKSKGKKGFWESLKDGAKNAIPFLSGALEIKKSIDLLAIVKKQSRGEKLTEKETETLYLYLLEQVENEHRGSSFWGKVGEGLSHMPAFAGEFMLTGGIYSLGKSAGTKVATKLVGEVTKKQLSKYITKKVAGVAVGAAARTFVLSNTYSGMVQRRLATDTSELKDDGTGKISLKESDESISASIGKGLLDGYIESFSEQTGEGFNYVLSKPLKKLPFIGKLFVPSLKTQKFMAKTGFNGLFEEYAEERFGGALRALTGLDERKDVSTAQKLYDAILPGWEQTGVELATTAIWGGGMHTVHSTGSMLHDETKSTQKQLGNIKAHGGFITVSTEQVQEKDTIAQNQVEIKSGVEDRNTIIQQLKSMKNPDGKARFEDYQIEAISKFQDEQLKVALSLATRTTSADVRLSHSDIICLTRAKLSETDLNKILSLRDKLLANKNLKHETRNLLEFLKLPDAQFEVVLKQAENKNLSGDFDMKRILELSKEEFIAKISKLDARLQADVIFDNLINPNEIIIAPEKLVVLKKAIKSGIHDTLEISSFLNAYKTNPELTEKFLALGTHDFSNLYKLEKSNPDIVEKLLTLKIDGKYIPEIALAALNDADAVIKFLDAGIYNNMREVLIAYQINPAGVDECINNGIKDGVEIYKLSVEIPQSQDKRWSKPLEEYRPVTYKGSAIPDHHDIYGNNRDIKETLYKMKLMSEIEHIELPSCMQAMSKEDFIKDYNKLVQNGDIKQIEDSVQDYDRQFAQLPPLEKDCIVYRGRSKLKSENLLKHIDFEIIDKAKAGDIVVPDEGYSYCAFDKSGTSPYLGGDKTEISDGILYTIRIPKGAKVSRNLEHDGEVLMPRAAKYKVISKYKENNVRYVVLEYILPDSDTTAPKTETEKAKDTITQTVNTRTQIATDLAPVISVYGQQLVPMATMGLAGWESLKSAEILGVIQAGVKTDSINESSISSKPPLKTVEQSTKSDVVSTMQPQKVKIAELLNDTVYIFENPKFYQFFIENKDLMIQTIKSYYDIKPWGENTKERKIIPEFTKNVSEKHLALLCDPGIISHLDDFYNFVKNFNGDINEISSLDLRKRFSDFLGTQKYYRGMILTEEQANKLKEKGITPNNFSGNYATETLAGIMLHSKKNYRNFMWDKVDGHNNGNPLISVTKLEKVARKVPLKYYALNNNKKLYVFELELPKINVIEPKGIFEISYGFGFYDENNNTIPNEDVESFIPFYISPDNITSVHKISS